MQPETIFGIHPLKLNRGWHFGAGRCTTQRIWFIKPLQLPGNFRNSKLETDFGVPRPKPGGVVLRQRIAPLGLTITDAAATRRVRRTTLSELVNGKARDFPRNGREAVEGLRRQRRKLAHAAGALRACACPRRPDQAQAAGTRLKGRPALSSQGNFRLRIVHARMQACQQASKLPYFPSGCPKPSCAASRAWPRAVA